MTTSVTVINKMFRDDDTGKETPYKRIAITGVINGETQTLELKATKNELMLADMLLKSTEKADITKNNEDFLGDLIDVKKDGKN